MKLPNALPLLALALPLVNAQIAGIAGTIDNSAEASSLQVSLRRQSVALASDPHSTALERAELEQTGRADA